MADCGGAKVPTVTDDPIATYLSVLTAIQTLHGTPILGEVLNGIESEEEAEEEAKPDSEELTDWAKKIGELLAYAAHYSAFACGGSAAAVVAYKGYSWNDQESSSIKQYLRVRRGRTIVASWPLDASLPVDELLAFCSPAPFGDLRTQTTVLGFDVRVAMEIPVRTLQVIVVEPSNKPPDFCLQAEAASPDGFSFEIAALKSGERTVVRPVLGPLPRPATNYGYGRGAYDNPGLGSERMQESFHDIEVASPLTASLTSRIRQKLMHDATTVVPYKLCIYGPGGFFKPHVDTPSLSAARMLGTAVVALPGDFSGGALRVCAAAGHLPVSAPGTPAIHEVVYDWGVPPAESAVRNKRQHQPGALPFAAFFGDCVHEVLPVTAGYRITVTFGIVADNDVPVSADATGAVEDDEEADDDADDAARCDDGPHAAAYSEATSGAVAPARAPVAVGAAVNIARILTAIAARPAAAASFGILLSHKYTLGAVSVGQLKGADGILHAALLASGRYCLSLRPVAYHYHRTGQYPGDSEPGSSSHEIHAFGAAELSALRGNASGASGSGSDSECSSGERRAKSGRSAADPRMPFVRFYSRDGYVLPGATPGALLKHESIEGAENTGNEARAGEDDYIYFSAALIITPLAAPPAVME